MLSNFIYSKQLCHILSNHKCFLCTLIEVRSRLQLWPVCLSQGVPHGFDLLKVARHVCGHDHLDDQSPQLPAEWPRHRINIICEWPHRFKMIFESGTACVCVCVPPVLLVQVNQDVHVLLGHQPVGGTDVMILQHWPVIVQNGHLRPDTQTTLNWGTAVWTWLSWWQ